MEDRNFDPTQDQETTDTKPTDKKRRQGSFLTQFLSKQKELLSGKSESDDEDVEDETSDKPKKWRRSFKSFFKNIVPPPEETKPAQSTAETGFLNWPDLEQAAYEAQSVPQETHSENLQHSETQQTQNEYQPTYHQSELPVETPESPPEIPSSDQIQYSNETFSAEQRDVVETADTIDTSDQIVDVPLNEPESTVYINDRPQINSTPEARDLPFVPQPERYVSNSQPTIEHERVVERNVGLALPVALVGAEYLGRKNADRKITKTFTEKTNELTKGADRASLSHIQLENLVKKNQTQLESLKLERGIVAERTYDIAKTPPIEKATPQIAVETSPPPPVTPEQTRVETSMEMPVDTVVENREQRPAHILEKVAEAAENDVPVERVFERSHEVKDDKSFATAASSIGSIMSSNASRQTNYSQAKTYAQHASQSQTEGLPVINDSQQSPELYKQAVQAGFGAALTIIVFGIVAYLMVK